jgi:hypothetical protein
LRVVTSVGFASIGLSRDVAHFLRNVAHSLPNLVAAVVERLPMVTSRLTDPLKRREPFAR